MQDDNKKKVLDLLGEIDTQKRKTGMFTPPTEQEIEEYRRRQLEQAAKAASQAPAVSPQQPTVKQPAPESAAEPYKRVSDELVTNDPTSEKPRVLKETEGAKEQVSRSFRELLSANRSDEKKEVGRMLAPTIERGFDAAEREIAAESEPEQAKAKKEIDPTTHPLFTTSKSVDIERIKRELTEKEVLNAAMASQTEEKPAASGELLVDDEARRRTSEGLLNVKEKVNDEFREFFGDTIIIDRDPTVRKSKQRRIKDFVPATKTEEAHIVFEDELSPDEADIIDEYRSDEDTEPILAELMSRQASSAMKLLFTTLLAFAVTVINLLSYLHVEVVESITASPIVFAGINLAAGLILFIMHIMQIGRGLKGLITLKGNAYSCCALCTLFMLAEPVVYYLLKAAPECYIAAPIGALCLMFAALGENIAIRGVLLNFKSISSGYEKYVSFIPESDEMNKRLTRELSDDEPQVLLKRKTGFSDNFLQNAFSIDSASYKYRAAPFILFILTLACGGVTYYRTTDLAAAFAAAALAAALSAALGGTLKSALPLSKMQRSVSRFGVIMPGFAAAERVTDVGSVLVDGREIFPKGSVLLHGIKTFDKELIDRAILYAASVIIPSCETLAPIFMNVIRGKTEMLYKTENITYEDKMGFSAWADGSRVLIGNRAMMQAHEIEIPSEDYELKYTKTRSRDAIYLAVGGSLYAMFVVVYTLSTEVEQMLEKYRREDISLLVRTNDFNITPKKISEIYSVPLSCVSVLKKSVMEYVSDELSYKAHSPSIMNHIGSLASYTTGVMACHKLVRCLSTTNFVGLIARLLGAAIAVALAVLGSVGAVGLVTVLIYHAIWLAILFVTAQFARY